MHRQCAVNAKRQNRSVNLQAALGSKLTCTESGLDLKDSIPSSLQRAVHGADAFCVKIKIGTPKLVKYEWPCSVRAQHFSLKRIAP